MKLPDGWIFTPRQDAKNRLKFVLERSELVRCRSCRYYNTHYFCGDGFGWCERNGIGHSTSDDWFCADGEKRSEDE